MDPNDDDDSLPPFQYSISASTTPVPPNSTTQATSESTTQHSSNSTILAGNGSTNLATASMTAQTSTTRSQPTFSVVRPSDVTQELQMYVEEHPVFHMEVRRDFILPDTIKATKRRGFKPTRRVKVEFVGENGDDFGGLARELWMLLGSELQNKLGSGGLFAHDAIALKESEFFAIGQLVATAVLQTSTRFPVFNHVMFEYLSGKTVADLSPKIGDVTDVNVTAFLLKVKDASSADNLQKVLMNDIDLLADSGYTAPISRATLESRESIIATVVLHHCLLKSKGEVDQFKDGISHESGPLLKMIEEHPATFESFFCVNKDKLSAGVYCMCYVGVKVHVIVIYHFRGLQSKFENVIGGADSSPLP
jgi:hypothetical protein